MNRNRRINRTLALAIGVALGLAIFTPRAHAGGPAYNPKLLQPQVNLANSGSSSSSTSKATSFAANGTIVSSALTGGATAVTTNNKTNAYAYTKSALTTSQGDCPLLGSVDLFLVSGTYEIGKCAMWRDVEMMTSVETAEGKKVFSLDSILNRICQEESIADVATECTNRKISRK